jgi:hypothetical protein
MYTKIDLESPSQNSALSSELSQDDEPSFASVMEPQVTSNAGHPAQHTSQTRQHAPKASQHVPQVVPLITAGHVAPCMHPIMPMPVIPEVTPMMPKTTRDLCVQNQSLEQEWMLAELPETPGERHILPLPYPQAVEPQAIIEADPLDADASCETRGGQMPVPTAFEQWVEENYPQKKSSAWETILGRMFGGAKSNRGNA